MYKIIRDFPGSVVGDATKRVYSDPLRKGVQRYWDDLNVSGTINITVAATRVINRGSILGAFNYIGINEGGTDVVKIDARTLGVYTDVLAEQPRSSTRLGGTGVAATPLQEMVRLSYAWPRPMSEVPQETVLVDSVKGDDKKVRIFAELRADGGQGGIVTGGTSNMSVTPQFTILERYDDITAKKPLLLPLISQDVLDVTSASNAKRYEFSLSDMVGLRAIILQQDTDQGEVGDIIKALKFMVGGRQIIGPSQANWDDLLRGMQLDSDGFVYATGVSYGQSSYLAIIFQDHGRLSQIQNPNLPNTAFEFNWQQSAQAGVTKSQVRLTFIGLRQVPGVTADSLGFAI